MLAPFRERFARPGRSVWQLTVPIPFYLWPALRAASPRLLNRYLSLYAASDLEGEPALLARVGRIVAIGWLEIVVELAREHGLEFAEAVLRAKTSAVAAPDWMAELVVDTFSLGLGGWVERLLATAGDRPRARYLMAARFHLAYRFGACGDCEDLPKEMLV